MGTEVDTWRVSIMQFRPERLRQELDRRAATLGHAEHVCYLRGHKDPTDEYQLWCERCDRAVVTVVIDRAAGQ